MKFKQVEEKIHVQQTLFFQISVKLGLVESVKLKIKFRYSLRP